MKETKKKNHFELSSLEERKQRKLEYSYERLKTQTFQDFYCFFLTCDNLVASDILLLFVNIIIYAEGLAEVIVLPNEFSDTRKKKNSAYTILSALPVPEVIKFNTAVRA